MFNIHGFLWLIQLHNIKLLCSLKTRQCNEPDAPTLDDCFFKAGLHRKEVIQPHLPIRLPCYDFTPVISLTFDGSSPASGAPNSHGVTGGVYKARERIHRGMLIRDY